MSMCERPDAGVMAIDRCNHGKASSPRPIMMFAHPAPSSHVQRDTCGVKTVSLPECRERVFERPR